MKAIQHPFVLVATVAVIILGVSLHWPSPDSAAGEPGPPLLGDVNKNGFVDPIDAALILQAGAGFLTLANSENADVNEDGEVTTVDAALILQYGAGLIGHLGPLPSATPISPPKLAIAWDIDPGVSAQDREAIEDGIRMASEYLDSHLGGSVQRPIVVMVTTADLCFGRPANAGPGAICIYTEHPAWLTSASYGLTKIAAHEYVHNLQFQLGCVSPALWLLEGSAEVIAYQVIIENGLITSEDAEASQVDRVTNTMPPLPPLQDLEEYSEQIFLPGIYSTFYLAVQQLTAAPGLLSLRDYCEAVGSGESWPTAFEAAFGTTAGSFYSLFEEYRQGLP